ncbi:hypothetical protein [Anseongella ginsenosidimutans]|nr:hypothetical protein [Anseongella ginsenosidimutans]
MRSIFYTDFYENQAALPGYLDEFARSINSSRASKHKPIMGEGI